MIFASFYAKYIKTLRLPAPTNENPRTLPKWKCTGEAIRGLPAVREIGLPAYRQYRNRGMDKNRAGAITLLHLVARVEDTNMLSRGGVDGQIGKKGCCRTDPFGTYSRLCGNRGAGPAVHPGESVPRRLCGSSGGRIFSGPLLIRRYRSAAEWIFCCGPFYLHKIYNFIFCCILYDIWRIRSCPCVNMPNPITKK